jgi:hypothetical protein
MGFEFLELGHLKEWEKIVDDNITSIYDPNGFGVLQVPEFTIPEDYKLNLFDELYDIFHQNTSVTLKAIRILRRFNLDYF